MAIASLAALALHLAAAVALAALGWQPPLETVAESATAAPIAFELLPTPAPTTKPDTEAPPAPASAATTAREEPPPQAPPPSTPTPAADAPSTPADPAPVLETTTATEPLPSPPTPARPQVPPPRRISAADILASRDQALASLARQQRAASGGAQGRRRTINASTQEYAYATYLESWRRKVERIGNLNYPEEAKEKRLFGNLVLHAAVRADGSLESVRVLRSSGHEVLDQAAVRIVELAAPFAPFPADIRARHDVLDIVRTWQFLRDQKLGWDN